MEALELRKKLLGAEHSNVAMSLHQIGITFRDLWDEEKALKYLMEAFEIYSKVFKEDHPMVLEVLKNIQMIQSELEANKDGWFTKQNIALGLLALGGITSYFYYKSKSEK